MRGATFFLRQCESSSVRAVSLTLQPSWDTRITVPGRHVRSGLYCTLYLRAGCEGGGAVGVYCLLLGWVRNTGTSRLPRPPSASGSGTAHACVLRRAAFILAARRWGACYCLYGTRVFSFLFNTHPTTMAVRAACVRRTKDDDVTHGRESAASPDSPVPGCGLARGAAQRAAAQRESIGRPFV